MTRRIQIHNHNLEDEFLLQNLFSGLEIIFRLDLVTSTHLLDHFLQMIFGSGSPEARHVSAVKSLPTEVVTFSNCWTFGLMITERWAEVSSLPALFSEMQV